MHFFFIHTKSFFRSPIKILVPACIVCITSIFTFQCFLLTDKPGGVPSTGEAVNNCEAFCTVVRSRLEKHSLCKKIESIAKTLLDFLQFDTHVNTCTCIPVHISLTEK